ncbi:hypothetical protein C4D60_Mb07t03570 [Musa balbisiana]|uniref:Uncharacterized protein n=1 Tax=Musa balbisiana TaxID=52838 RepID=A0A4S8JCQ5_MUSBA|nr:hypothetical protein C4D60_Mb07t03570 [Musa balbisiana]
MVFVFFGSGGGNFSTVMVSTPSLYVALTTSTLALSGSENLRMNLPIRRSILRYFTSSSSSFRRRSPLTTRTQSSSTWTLISLGFSSGMSTTKT